MDLETGRHARKETDKQADRDLRTERVTNRRRLRERQTDRDIQTERDRKRERDREREMFYLFYLLRTLVNWTLSPSAVSRVTRVNACNWTLPTIGTGQQHLWSVKLGIPVSHRAHKAAGGRPISTHKTHYGVRGLIASH